MNNGGLAGRITKLAGGRFGRTAILSAMSTLSRVGTGLISGKVVAAYSGPTGVAFLSQLTSLQALLVAASALGSSAGVVAGVSEASNDVARQRAVISTAALSCTIAVALVTAGVFIWADRIAASVFGGDNFAALVRLSGAVLVFSVMGSIASSTMNGRWRIVELTAAGLVAGVLSCALLCLLVMIFGSPGVLYAGIASQLVWGIMPLAVGLNTGGLHIRDFLHPPARWAARKLATYSVMTVLSGVLMPVTLISLRSMIASRLTLEDVGLWQATWRISEIYLSLFTGTLATYFLPRFAEITGNYELKRELLRSSFLLLPASIVVGTSVYLCRSLIIHVAYSDHFDGALPLFAFQVVGDVIKMGSWVLGFALMARGRLVSFVISELFFALCFCCLGTLAVASFGLIGITYAYAASYAGHLALLVFLMRRIVFAKRHP